jgi:hypothetical protein
MPAGDGKRPEKRGRYLCFHDNEWNRYLTWNPLTPAAEAYRQGWQRVDATAFAGAATPASRAGAATPASR